MKQKLHAREILIICAFIAFGILGGLFCIRDAFGVPANKLEHDIHTFSHVPDDWTVTGQVSDTVAAFISYPDDLSDYTCDLYVTREGFFFGYFFRGGGMLNRFEEPISGYVVDGYRECAYFSKNEHQIVKATVYDGATTRVIELDGNLPFAIVIPISEGAVTFYDAQGNEVRHFVHPL